MSIVSLTYYNASFIVDEDSHLANSSMMAATQTSAMVASGSALLWDPRIVAGSAGSIVSALVSQPFEVAKVKQQNYRPTLMGGIGSNSSYGTAVVHRHPGPLSMLRSVIAKEGVQGAYRGIAPTIVMSVPNYVLYLTAYDEIVARLRRWSFSGSDNNSSIPLIGGALARLIATTAVAPLELLRTRDASSTSNQSSQSALTGRRQGGGGVWSELVRIVQTDGVGALYKGIVPSLARDVPFAAMYMLCLEQFRDISRPYLLPRHLEAATTERQVAFEFTNAALAGMVAASFTAPLDVVKTRFQSAAQPQNEHQQQQRTTILRVIRSIIKEDGVAALWRGNQARMLKVAPQYAIMISFYEVGKKVLA